MHSSAINVVPFRTPRFASSPRRDQKGLMEAVYTAGSLPVQADDRETKTMAARLQIFGFVIIEEIEADGTPRRLKPSEAVEARLARPWRISKPSIAGLATGRPDADGHLKGPRETRS
jgi:hypothetical protein